MSIEALIASTPPPRRKQKKSKSSTKPKKPKSPDLLAPIGKWVDYFHDMNDEQMNVLQLRLKRLYGVSWSVLKTRQEEQYYLAVNLKAAHNNSTMSSLVTG